jgi:hypothetical protein
MPPLQILLNLPFILTGVIIKSIFFASKGMAGEYLRGIITGILKAGGLKRVGFESRYLGNYIRIQFELWINILKILMKY